MCKTTLNRSPTCPHAWLSLSESCNLHCSPDEENDLLTCPLFQEGMIAHQALAPEFKEAKNDECPQCDYETYERRDFRMCRVTDSVGGVWGKKDWEGGKREKGGRLRLPGRKGEGKGKGNDWGESKKKKDMGAPLEVLCCCVM